MLLVRAACGSVTDAQDAIDHVADGNLAQRLRKTLPHVEAARPRMPQVVLLDLPSTSLQPIAEGVFGGIAQGLIPALALGKGCLNAIDEDTAETSEPIERAPLSREFGGARIAPGATVAFDRRKFLPAFEDRPRAFPTANRLRVPGSR